MDNGVRVCSWMSMFLRVCVCVCVQCISRIEATVILHTHACTRTHARARARTHPPRQSVLARTDAHRRTQIDTLHSYMAGDLADWTLASVS